MKVADALTPLIHRLAGGPLRVRFAFWDGSSLGPDTARATVHFRGPEALQRLVAAPGELGLGRAYVAGEIELEGDLDAVLDMGVRDPDLSLGPGGWVDAVRSLRRVGALRPRRLPHPPEEARLSGRRPAPP